MKLIVSVIIVSVCVFALLNNAAHAKQEQVRPVKIRIIDAVSKKPLKGVTVYYVLTKIYMKKKIFLFFNHPDPPMTRNNISKLKLTTDGKGEVSLPVQLVKIKSNEFLNEENIYINLDIDITNLDPELYENMTNVEILDFNMRLYGTSTNKDIYRINSRYRGYYIKSTKHEINPDDYGGSKRDKFDILWNGKGLLGTQVEFVIELQRHIEQ